MSGTGPRWYAAHTHPHAEAQAESHLKRQGFVTYLPRYLKRRRHARRVEAVATPLFPRYLFVRVDLLAQRWRAIQSTVGIHRLVGAESDPVAVPDEVIEQLRRREAGGLVRLPPRLAPGDAIRIVDGAFAFFTGLYEGMRDEERVAVLLDLLGRKVRLVMDVDLVEAA